MAEPSKWSRTDRPRTRCWHPITTDLEAPGSYWFRILGGPPKSRLMATIETFAASTSIANYLAEGCRILPRIRGRRALLPRGERKASLMDRLARSQAASQVQSKNGGCKSAPLHP